MPEIYNDEDTQTLIYPDHNAQLEAMQKLLNEFVIFTNDFNAYQISDFKEEYTVLVFGTPGVEYNTARSIRDGGRSVKVVFLGTGTEYTDPSKYGADDGKTIWSDDYGFNYFTFLDLAEIAFGDNFSGFPTVRAVLIFKNNRLIFYHAGIKTNSDGVDRILNGAIKTVPSPTPTPTSTPTPTGTRTPTPSPTPTPVPSPVSKITDTTRSYTYPDCKTQLEELQAIFDNFEIVTNDGKTYHATDFNSEYTVFVLGRAGCGLTQMTYETAQKHRNMGKSVKIVFLAIDDKLSLFSDYVADDPQTVWSDNYTLNHRMFWNLVRTSFGGSYSGSILLPAALVYQNNRLIFFHAGNELDYANVDRILYGAAGKIPTPTPTPKPTTPPEETDRDSVTVGGKKYTLGMTEAALKKLAGQPEEVLKGIYGFNMYVYGTSTYDNLLIAGVSDGKVVTLFSSGPGFTYCGVSAGDSNTTGQSSVCTDKNDNYIVHAVLLSSGAGSFERVYTDETLYGESRVNFHLTNGFRRYHGLAPLIWSDSAAKAAKLHSQDMADQDYFDHTSLDGRSPWERMGAQGISYSSASENIAAGYSNGASAYEGWVNSSGHRSNMLGDTKYLGVGTGYNSSSYYGIYYTQDFFR